MTASVIDLQQLQQSKTIYARPADNRPTGTNRSAENCSDVDILSSACL